MSKRATEDLLSELHEVIATELRDQIKNGTQVAVKDEETGEMALRRASPNASLINVARQFLKDNGIDTPEKKKPATPITALADALDEELPGLN